MDRCALFVDAGYLLADGAMAVHGTRHRESVSWDYPGLLQLLSSLSRERTGLPLLRCYWYEATIEGRRTSEHDLLADIPGLKLRLSRIRPGRREGVDAQVHRDLMTLARNSAVCDAVVVSGDEDLTQVVCDAQDLGVRLTVVHIAADGGWAASRTLRQECDDLIELGAAHLRPYVSLVTGASEAVNGHQAISNGHGAHALPPGSSSLHSASATGTLSGMTGSLQSAATGTPTTGGHSTGTHSTGSHATSSATGSHATGGHVTSSHATGSHATGGHVTSSYATGGHTAGSHATGGHVTGSHATDSHATGSHGTGSHATGGQGTGSHATGSQGTGSHATGSHGTGSHGTGSHATGSHAAPSRSSGAGQSSAHSRAQSQPPVLPTYTFPADPPAQQQPAAPMPQQSPTTGQFSSPSSAGGYQQLGPYTGPQPAPVAPQPAATSPSSGATTLADAVKAAHREGHDFGESVARDAPALWLEAVLARKPRMPSDLEARLLQGSSLPIDFLLHDEVRHALRRGFWDALERARS
ncbi:NYN domain-containing protein [Nonomuraea sp. MCN248]|uniref:NYN domain-containing protein n=1 Tax=Nonomuraea corallina TaxID=2989783 RepID=A0ABT4S8X3_9ACTN|nr:NYN domain-containing protein [Nonomuraea corallina]MDA0633661.1 NYN domain-containing protein [Nonomuraea corallina]